MTGSAKFPSGTKLTFVGGVGTVTGANFLLETRAGSRILVDCGLIQGEKAAVDENREPFPYEPSSIQALLITHAHLDHVGRIPKLVKEGFTGPIYSTPETKALAELVLNDAAGIIGNEARQEGKAPLYDANDVARVFPLWKTAPYHQEFKVADDVSAFLKDAGHILGSAMIEVTIGSIPAFLPAQTVRGLPRLPSRSSSPAIWGIRRRLY
jgi:metallo-beta-lactamase family protein